MPLYLVTDKPFIGEGKSRVVEACVVNAWRPNNACYTAMEMLGTGYAGALFVRECPPILYVGRVNVDDDTSGIIMRTNDTEKRWA